MDVGRWTAEVTRLGKAGRRACSKAVAHGKQTLSSTMSNAKKAPAGNRPRTARANPISGCALTAALAAVGGRWKLFVVYRLAEGPRHFAALRRSLPEVSTKVLVQQLREL